MPFKGLVTLSWLSLALRSHAKPLLSTRYGSLGSLDTTLPCSIPRESGSSSYSVDIKRSAGKKQSRTSKTR